MIEKIACRLGRNDEEPNIALAVLLSETKDKEGIKEIAEGLKSKKKEVASDCIKVLYEIGERTPELVADHVYDFIQLLKSSNNRLVWGGMTALSKITLIKHKEIYEQFAVVKHAYEAGSVFTVDNAISVFAHLCKADEKYEGMVFPHILTHLMTCKPREVGQHSERAFVCVNKRNAKEFADVLLKRRDSLTDAQRGRIDKLLKKLEKYST